MKTVSVVVPTRNRQSCVKVLIKSLMDTTEKFQLIIADNSDDDSLRHDLELYQGDPRLTYHYSSETLSVVENFNRALDMATGDYVAFIGDDDILSRHFFEVVILAEKNDVDAVIYGKPGRVLHYFWPGVQASYWGDVGGCLFYSDFSGEFFQYSHTQAMANAAARLGSGPQEMPRAYLGLISKKLIEKVKLNYGPVFGGCSPDVYSSHLLSACAEKVFICDYPFIIPGASPKSTSAMRAERTDVGGLTDNDHLGRFANMNWDEQVPKYYAPYTVWAQSHLDALRMTNYKVPSSSFLFLYARCFIFTRGHRAEILKAIRSKRSFLSCALVYAQLGPVLAFVALQYVLEKVPALVRKRPGGAKFKIDGCADIYQAAIKLEGELAGRDIVLKTCH